jgi:hypothetical protein
MRTLLLLLLITGIAVAQEYPRWFLSQDQVQCQRKIVSVMRAPSLHRDSAVALAFRVSCDLLAKYTKVSVKGGQAFWTTEAGVSSMGASYTEEYDSSLNDIYQSTLKVLDTFIDKQKTIVLAGDSSSCAMNDLLRERVSVGKIKQPEWVEKLPDDKRYYYGVGSSEEYFYESSSWQRAEHNAFMSLARTGHSTVQSLQKKNVIESQDVFNEDVDVTLQNVEIVARWRDVKKKVFYVMAKTNR